MEWSLIIERNGQALARILASLMAMAALTGGAPTLPRRLHRAVLRLLRPAESAARRLIIMAARGIVVTLPPRRARKKPKPRPTILRHRSGTGIILPRGVTLPPPLTPPHRGERSVDVAESPSPLWGGIEGGGKTTHTPALPLLDPLRHRSGPARPTPTGVPRISLPGWSQPFPVPVRRPPSPDDAISAVRLAQRLKALAAALDDLPGQARRFARWQARRDAATKASRAHRVSPLRPGPAHGVRRRYSRRRAHEVDEVLRDVHYFAHCALYGSDTS